MTRNTGNPGNDASGVFDPLGDSASVPNASHHGDDSPSPDRDERSPAQGEDGLRRMIRSDMNKYFDAEASRDRVAAREALHDLSRLPGGPEELAAMRRVLSGFDVRPEYPDLTRVVLAKAAKRGAFLSRPARRRVSAARVLIACSLVIAVGAAVYIDRATATSEQGPVGAIHAVVEAQRTDAAESVRNLTRAVGDLRADLIDPVGALVGNDPAPAVASRRPVRSLAMGDTSDYEESSTPRASGGHGMPLTKLLAPVGSNLGNRRTDPNIAGMVPSADPQTTQVARAIAAAGDAWTVAPASPSLLRDIGELPSQDVAASIAVERPVASVDLSDLTAAGALESLDASIARGGLLASVNRAPDLGAVPQVRLRPDGSRTVLWWAFPGNSPANAALNEKK